VASTGRDLLRRAWRIYRPINFAIWVILSLILLTALIWKGTGHG
jgi:hypothetical protein